MIAAQKMLSDGQAEKEAAEQKILTANKIINRLELETERLEKELKFQKDPDNNIVAKLKDTADYKKKKAEEALQRAEKAKKDADDAQEIADESVKKKAEASKGVHTKS